MIWLNRWRGFFKRVFDLIYMGGIYKISSKKKPERIYIGSTKDVNLRKQFHLSQLKHKRHHSQKLQRHYDKYGANDLIFTIIISCDESELIEKEQFFIDVFNPYFNGCMIAGSRRNYVCSEETKKKIKISKSNISEETREKLRKSHTGLKQSPETVEKRASKNRGQKRSEETCKILRKTLRPFKKGENKRTKVL